MRSRLSIIALFAFLLSSCTLQHGQHGEGRQFRGVYYWKTVFALDSIQRSFLTEHEIDRMYVRLFDVGVEADPKTQQKNVVPIGTIRFDEPVPDNVEIVPCVYITTEAVRRNTGHMDSLAVLITRRVLNMSSYNHLGNIREVQFDCDWTTSTQDEFYHLCECSRKIFSENGIVLSGTVRLHQLTKKVLPFEKGVLMVYNTGAMMSEKSVNSILDTADVAKYLSPRSLMKFRKYRKHNCKVLDVAYPIYGWGVAFRDGKFLCLVHDSDYSDETLFSSEDGNWVEVKKDARIDGVDFVAGDRIRREVPSAEVILRTKEMIDAALDHRSHGNIVYHLDSASIVGKKKSDLDRILE